VACQPVFLSFGETQVSNTLSILIALIITLKSADRLADSLVKNRRQPIPGLKGQNIPAQGNALGIGNENQPSPERASQMNSPQPCVSPFQG